VKAVLGQWFRRYFSDPQAVLLTVLLVVGFGLVMLIGDWLAPVLAAIVFAYLLEGVVRYLQQWGASRRNIVYLVFLIFLAFLLFLVFGLTPLLWQQAVALVDELPSYINHGQQLLMALPQHYPFISEEQVREVLQVLRIEITGLGPKLLSFSLASIPNIIIVLVYLILVPLLVFFFLKDKALLINWFIGFLPKERGLAREIWREVDQQIGNYVRGKFWEILIVGVVTFVVFSLLGLKYAILLAVLVGLSVIVPYIGAAAVTVPVAIVGYFQWGWSSEFVWLMAAYGIIQALDGNVLVPLLFSEVVNLHPVAIIVAILFFGGVWGFWGIFFAIPLATLVSAILSAWPSYGGDEPESSTPPAASE